MDKIFEIRLPDPNDAQLKSLHDLCGDSLESILEIAVLKPPDGQLPNGASADLLAYRQLGLMGPDVYTDWRFVFDQQVTRWTSAIAYRRESPALLKRLSPSLHELSRRSEDFPPDWADVPFMRSVRMLLLLEALLVPEITFDSAQTAIGQGPAESDWRVWRRRLHREAGALRDASGDLRALLSSVSGATMRIGDTDWHVSLPLLMLIAVVYSQYEYYASVFWQAHSALRARDVLHRRWETALKRIPGLEHGCDFVALLIRYQSAVGKAVRQSGDTRFMAAARRFAEQTGGTFSPSVVFDALGLMSILEEARLRRLPGTGPDTSIGRCRLNAGTVQAWESAEPGARDWLLLEREDLTEDELQAFGSSGESLERFIGRVFRSRATLGETLGQGLASSGLSPTARAELVDQLVEKARQTAAGSIQRIAAASRLAAPSPPRQTNYTWTYASRLDVSDDLMRTFKQFVEAHYQALLGPDQADSPPEVAVFSFGLSQARDLKQLLEQGVAEVARAVRDTSPERRKEAGVKAFGRHFRLCATEIPCHGSSGELCGRVERVVEIQLIEERAAWGLLLPGDGDPKAPGGGIGRAKRRSAADLLSWLFDKAGRRLASGQHTLYGWRYVPFPLFDRMLEVVARLRPTESLSVAVEFDGRRRLLRLPAGLDQHRHGPLIETIANYVHAVVLNQAMTYGFQSCDVSFDGLEDASGGKSPRGKRMTAAKWQQTIKEAYHRNCYEVLVDKYLRDYNTERKSVQFLEVSRPTTTLKKPSPEKVAVELQQWLKANANRESKPNTPKTHLPDNETASAPLLLGLDIGATLTKIQFYSARSGRLAPVGGSYQINTPRLSDAAGPQVDDPAGHFAAELVASVEQISRSDEELRARFEGGRATVLCVGATWPGPVRQNHVAGTSRILGNFPPLSRHIGTNRIEAILDLDIAGAIRCQCRQSHYLTKGREPFAALLNDGDGAGYGTLVIDGKLPGRRLAVVKIGTGTATTVLDDGQLVAGPCEGGKVLLDLGATPARERPGGLEYPNGVANAYLSRRLLPALAKKLVKEQNLDFRVDKLGNREIGLFLAADPRPLRDQCGLRDLAEEKSIGVEILRRVLKRKDKAEIELQHQVERILNVGGTAAIARLPQLVQERGLIRLAEVLRLPTEQLRHYFECIDKRSPDPQTTQVQERMARFRRQVVEPSVRALGEYLGDFLVLLAAQYGVDAFVVAGGVVRQRTGVLVREVAIRRAARYGFRLRLSGSLLEVIERPPWMVGVETSGRQQPAHDGGEHQPGASAGRGCQWRLVRHCRNRGRRAAPGTQRSSQTGGQPAPNDASLRAADNTPSHSDSDSDPGYATAGAAAFAAGEFLLREKQKGLEELRAKILRLATNKCATLTPDRICFEDGEVGDIMLAQHALAAAEVKEFLARERAVVQTESAERTTSYVRIPAERSQALEVQH